jgi:hypothetical protein
MQAGRNWDGLGSSADHDDDSHLSQFFGMLANQRSARLIQYTMCEAEVQIGNSC